MLDCEGTAPLPLHKLNMTLVSPPNTSGVYTRNPKEPKYFTVAKSVNTLANNHKIFSGVDIKPDLLKSATKKPELAPLPRVDEYPIAPKGSYYETRLEDLSKRPAPTSPYLTLTSAWGILPPTVSYSGDLLDSLTAPPLADAPRWLIEAHNELMGYTPEDLEVQEILGTGIPLPPESDTEGSPQAVPMTFPKRDPDFPDLPAMGSPPTPKLPRQTADALARREAILMSPSVAARIETTQGSLTTRNRAYPRTGQYRFIPTPPPSGRSSSASSFEIPMRRGGTTTASLAQRAPRIPTPTTDMPSVLDFGDMAEMYRQ